MGEWIDGREYRVVTKVTNSATSEPYWQFQTVILAYDVKDKALVMICDRVNEGGDPSHDYEVERIPNDADPFLILSDWITAEFGADWRNHVNDLW